MSIESVMPSSHLILCRPLLLLPSIFPASRSLLMSQLFISGGQRIRTSASVLPVNIQGLFTLGLTDLISLLSRGLSRVFSSTMVQKHQFFSTLYGPTLPSAHDYWKNHSFQFSSVTQSCPTLFDPMNRSTPGLPVHHQLLEFTQTHVH